MRKKMDVIELNLNTHVHKYLTTMSIGDIFVTNEHVYVGKKYFNELTNIKLYCYDKVNACITSKLYDIDKILCVTNTFIYDESNDMIRINGIHVKYESIDFHNYVECAFGNNIFYVISRDVDDVVLNIYRILY